MASATIEYERPAHSKLFTVAVLACFQNTSAISHRQRLWSLLHLLANNYRDVRILLFTTAPEPEVRFSSVKVFSDKKPSLPFGRRLLLRRWAKQAKEADALWCFGLRSFIKTQKHTLLYLLEGEAANLQRHRKTLQQASVLAATLEKERLTAAPFAKNVILLNAVAFDNDAVQTSNEVKGRYTGGSEYFLYYDAMENEAAVMQLLRAFSVFKRRQKSSWSLVLLCARKFPQALATALNTYKYRSDVPVIEQDKTVDVDSVVASAYAAVHLTAPSAYGRHVMATLAAGIPVIATKENGEVLQDAALYADAEDAKDLSEALMQVYKDEALHSRLAEASKERAKAFAPEAVAAALYRALGGPQQ